MPHYDDEEARRLFANHAQKSKKELALPDVAQGALRELLRQLSGLAQKFGLTAQPLNESEGDGIEISGKEEKAAIVALERSQLVVYTPHTNNKDKEPIPLAWDPIEHRFEGLEDDAGSSEPGYRKGKRSALAVVAEAVLKRMA